MIFHCMKSVPTLFIFLHFHLYSMYVHVLHFTSLRLLFFHNICTLRITRTQLWQIYAQCLQFTLEPRGKNFPTTQPVQWLILRRVLRRGSQLVRLICKGSNGWWRNVESGKDNSKHITSEIVVMTTSRVTVITSCMRTRLLSIFLWTLILSIPLNYRLIHEVLHKRIGAHVNSFQSSIKLHMSHVHQRQVKRNVWNDNIFFFKLSLDSSHEYRLVLWSTVRLRALVSTVLCTHQVYEWFSPDC